jgi:hypothetical protein
LSRAGAITTGHPTAVRLFGSPLRSMIDGIEL